MNDEPFVESLLFRCSRHGTKLTRKCRECSSLGLSDEQWLTREAREAGKVLSVPLCRWHGNVVGKCPAGC